MLKKHKKIPNKCVSNLTAMLMIFKPNIFFLPLYTVYKKYSRVEIVNEKKTYKIDSNHSLCMNITKITTKSLLRGMKRFWIYYLPFMFQVQYLNFLSIILTRKELKLFIKKIKVALKAYYSLMKILRQGKILLLLLDETVTETNFI